MAKERKRQVGEEKEKEPFTTIDDLAQTAEKLAAGLRQLGEQKHPLDVRRGIRKREGVVEMAEDERSMTLKAGAKTYFFDLKETKEKKPFLVITESRFKGEGEERERSSILVFPEDADDFAQAVSEMTEKLG